MITFIIIALATDNETWVSYIPIGVVWVERVNQGQQEACLCGLWFIWNEQDLYPWSL